MLRKAIDPGIETYGESIGAIVDGFRLFPSIAFKYLIKHHLAKPSPRDGKVEIDRKAWYPTAQWIAAYDDIAQEVGTGPLFDIGVLVPENAPFPPHIVNVDSAMQSLDAAYHLNHRKNGVVMFDPGTGQMLDGIGHYGYQRAGERKILSACDNPFPCDFDRGVITGVVTRFAPRAKVVHEPGICRREGGASCTYAITW